MLEFLLDRFEYQGYYKSKKKRRGASTGDDATLYISVDGTGTLVWWRENRGFETTIFDGKELKTEEEFEQLFDWLEIKRYLRW